MCRRQECPAVRSGGAKLKELPHPSTVTGLAFDARGKRVCASHYNGASLWFVAAKEDSPRKLEWKGSHTAFAIHPDGDAVVTAMQENSLHGWRLSDNQHMRMSGYPSKTAACRSPATASGWRRAVPMRWCCGRSSVAGRWARRRSNWRAATASSARALRRIHATRWWPGGFADGLVVLADVNSSRVLPVAPPGRGAVSALVWSPDGSQLAVGTENGFAAIVDLAKRG